MPEPELKPEVAIDDAQDKAIEIDLDKPDGKSAEKTSSEAKYVSVEELEKIRKQLNGLSYLGRRFEEVSKKIDSLNVAPAQRPAPVQGDKDPYEDLLEKDWKKAVRTLAREEAESVRQTQIQQDYQRQLEQKKVSILEDSRSKVRSKYPEIDDQDSEVARKFMKILNQNPDYLQNERGPLLAMRDMEDELKAEGKLDSYSQKAVEKEVNRQVRTAVTSVPKSAPSGGNKVTITKEQKEFCDHNNIRYEDYAKIISRSSGRQVEA